MGRLEDTVQVIVDLRRTIDSFREHLERNEIQTRSSLIDPMLRVLGWDVGNPHEVALETGRGAGVADYALKNRNTGMPLVLMEAKSLNTDLGRARAQVANYCYGEAVESAIVTDGDDWLLLDIESHISDDEEDAVSVVEVARFSISHGDAVISAVNAQRFGNPLSNPGHWRTEIEGALVLVPGSNMNPPTDLSPESRPGDVKTLASLKELSNPPVPSRLHFYDGCVLFIHTPEWPEVVRQVAIYLGVLYGNLHQVELPIWAYRSRTKYVANDRPRHDNRRDFGLEFEVSDGIYVELDHTPRSGVNAACTLLDECGIDPHQITVEFGNNP